MKNEKYKVNFVTEDGKEIEYERLLTFRRGNKFYTVMTDHTKDEDGDINTYAYCIEDGETSLKPVEDEKELEMVNIVFNKVQEEC